MTLYATGDGKKEVIIDETLEAVNISDGFFNRGFRILYRHDDDAYYVCRRLDADGSTAERNLTTKTYSYVFDTQEDGHPETFHMWSKHPDYESAALKVNRIMFMTLIDGSQQDVVKYAAQTSTTQETTDPR